MKIIRNSCKSCTCPSCLAVATKIITRSHGKYTLANVAAIFAVDNAVIYANVNMLLTVLDKTKLEVSFETLFTLVKFILVAAAVSLAVQ
jgi:hypothetical protein